MSNYLIKLIEEKNEKNIFSMISTPRKNEWVTWENILKDFTEFLPHKSIDKKYFWDKDLTILDRFGFDIDHEDSYGNTLLFHLFQKSSHQNNIISFDSKDILKKTNKLYHINNYNENILFYMAKNLNSVEWEKPEDFITGKNLIDFIEKHPELDIYQFNKMNRNLINMCLLNNSFPYQLFSYLKDKNVSISHLDTDNYNLLNFFPIIYFKKELGEIFINLCQHNDITNENKFKDSCISSFIDFISSDNRSNNEKTHLQWLTFIFQGILDKKIPINNKSQLLKILNVNTDKYSSEAKQIISLQNETIGFIKYLILDEKFPIKNVDSKKIKI